MIVARRSMSPCTRRLRVETRMFRSMIFQSRRLIAEGAFISGIDASLADGYAVSTWGPTFDRRSVAQPTMPNSSAMMVMERIVSGSFWSTELSIQRRISRAKGHA